MWTVKQTSPRSSLTVDRCPRVRKAAFLELTTLMRTPGNAKRTALSIGAVGPPEHPLCIHLVRARN